MASSITNLETYCFDNDSIKFNKSNKSDKSNESEKICGPNINNINCSLSKFCYIESENNIIIDHYYFRQYMKNNPDYLESLNTLNHIISQIEKVLINYSTFNVHLKIKSLTLIEIDRHKDLITMMSIMLKQKFPDKLNSCLIYEAPFIFSSLFTLISSFIDKETQKKIHLIK
jgi:hypothetical protein